MADVDTKPRKSVAFADGEQIVDSNGDVNPSHPSAGGDDKDVDDATNDFDALALGAKKKKKKAKKEGEDDEAGDGAAADDGEVDLSALKKKKKKKPKAPDADFDAKLAAAGDDEAAIAAVHEEAEEAKQAASSSKSGDAAGLQDGDMVKGTGIWAHDEEKPINYDSLLSRFFALLHSTHPDLGAGGMKSYKIPPPQCLREGNKKTIFANIAEICKRMKRTDEHVTQFLFAELGTSGSVDGSRRLVIKGRFQQKQIENVLRRYIGKCYNHCSLVRRVVLTINTVEYVTCKTCRSPDTELNKGENRLYFVTCNSCHSRRSVTAIKTGFSAQVGKRKRQQG